jgi:hypothetical protein
MTGQPERVSAIHQSVSDARAAVDDAVQEYERVILARAEAERAS